MPTLRFQVRWEALKHFEPGRDRVGFAFWHSDWPGEGGSQLLFKRRPGVMGCRAPRTGLWGRSDGCAKDQVSDREMESRAGKRDEGRGGPERYVGRVVGLRRGAGCNCISHWSSGIWDVPAPHAYR